MKTIINYFKKLFKIKQSDKVFPKQAINYEKNKIYPIDEYAEIRMNQWLDDVIDKHHGDEYNPEFE